MLEQVITELRIWHRCTHAKSEMTLGIQGHEKATNVKMCTWHPRVCIHDHNATMRNVAPMWHP